MSRDLATDSFVKKPYFCSICNKGFSRKTNLKSHSLIHTGNVPYSCSICNKSFSQKCSLTRHSLLHTGKKSFACAICNKKFFQKSLLKSHSLIHAGEKPFSCSICNKSFFQRSHLTKHNLVHTRKKTYSCSICSESFSRKPNLTAHSFLHAGKKPYSCDMCDKSFSNKYRLKGHYIIHSGEKPYSCDICIKGFFRESELKSHSVIHTGEKPYFCKICNKRFSFKATLNIHILAHTGTKPYSCTVCNKTFTQKASLNAHRLLHTNEKPHSCVICNKAFSHIGNLNVHCLTHTGEKPYSCDVCNKSFSRKSTLSDHSLVHTGMVSNASLNFLPDNYCYKIQNYEEKEDDKFIVSFKIKNVRTEVEVMKWLKEYQNKSKVTWRISRKKQAKGRFNIYRGDFRCQHKTDPRGRKKQVKRTKNTDCPATLKVIIKRYFDVPKLRKLDEETLEYPCIVDLSSLHNHIPDSVGALRCQDLSTIKKKKLLLLHETGHMPSSAQHALQNDYSRSTGQLSENIASVVHHEEFNNSKYWNNEEVQKTVFIIASNEQSSENFLEPLTFNPSSSDNDFSTAVTKASMSHCEEGAAQNQKLISSVNRISKEDKKKLKNEIMDMAKEICLGIDNDEEVFFPAAKKMILNKKRYASNKTGLISAMHNFASPTARKTALKSLKKGFI